MHRSVGFDTCGNTEPPSYPELMTTTAELPGYVQRRRLLSGLGAGFIGWTAGCVSTTNDTDDTNDTATNDTATNDTDDTNDTATNDTTNDTDTNTTRAEHSRAITIVCRSRTSTSRTVTLELSRDTTQIQQTTFQLDPDTETTITTPITEPGRYELTVSVAAGQTTTRPFAIDDYDLRAGSNLIVEISGSDIMWYFKSSASDQTHTRAKCRAVSTNTRRHLQARALCGLCAFSAT